jgi:hypothetical protein
MPLDPRVRGGSGDRDDLNAEVLWIGEVAAAGIEIRYLFERRLPAVLEVRAGDLHVTESGNLKRPGDCQRPRGAARSQGEGHAEIVEAKAKRGGRVAKRATAKAQATKRATPAKKLVKATKKTKIATGEALGKASKAAAVVAMLERKAARRWRRSGKPPVGRPTVYAGSSAEYSVKSWATRSSPLSGTTNAFTHHEVRSPLPVLSPQPVSTTSTAKGCWYFTYVFN